MIELNKGIFFRSSRTLSRASHVVVLLGLLIAGIYVTGEIAPILPARQLAFQDPYGYEGETQFLAGNISSAIEAYEKAINKTTMPGTGSHSGILF